MAKRLLYTLGILIFGAFAFLLGAASMTGISLNTPGNIIIFLCYNGLVLLGVILGIKLVWQNKSGQW